MPGQRVVAAGEDPSVVAVTGHRFAPANVRATLRQIKAGESVVTRGLDGDTWAYHARPR